MKTRVCLLTMSIALAASVFSGCVRTQRLVKPVKLDAQPVVEHLPLNIELRMNPEYRDASWELKFMGTTRMPFGEHLVLNTEDCARAVFADVVITSNGLAAPVAPGASAILIPRVVYVDMWGASASHDSLSMAIEWSLYDAHKQLVWIDSFRSERKGPLEGVSGGRKIVQRRYDLVIGEILRQARQAMSSSRELRQFAASVKSP